MRRLIVVCILALLTPAHAQQTPEPSETTEKFGAWTVRCVSQGDNGGKACEVFLAVQGQGGLIAQLAFGRPQAGGTTLAVARTPLGVLLSQPLALGHADENPPAVSLPFTTCLANGCIAQAGVDGGTLGRLTAGETATLSFAERTGRKLQINIPLAGLGDALSRIGLVCSDGTCAEGE